MCYVPPLNDFFFNPFLAKNKAFSKRPKLPQAWRTRVVRTCHLSLGPLSRSPEFLSKPTIHMTFFRQTLNRKYVEHHWEMLLFKLIDKLTQWLAGDSEALRYSSPFSNHEIQYTITNRLQSWSHSRHQVALPWSTGVVLSDHSMYWYHRLSQAPFSPYS